MAESDCGVTGTIGRTRTGGAYALPAYAHRPRQRLGTGVVVVLLTGLAAVGLAGFLSFSALFDRSEATTHPVADDPPGGAAETERPPEEGAGAEILTANPVYDGGELPAASCDAPELDHRDDVSMEEFLHETTDCLDDAWGEYFETADLPFEEPNRIYWYTSGQSPCGNYPARGVAAFYCKANEGLYLGLDDIVQNSGDSEYPEAYAFLLSHEYGHHVQGEAGILGYLHSIRGDEHRSDRDALTRRSELQANCLSGNFLGSVADSYPIGSEERANILEDAERRGDYDPGGRTHGSPENGSMWTAHGMDRRNPAACNTWIAREDLVE
ncbi:neutral zinc metallopeptidase [Allosalinactinospora lopnorensis]|uniref:neutral zinc metallopeptidase n=1 Tax=Allosalinactinospora lopnorensis TaxID=1352348 RepID=UPI000623D533|nr:neutral zinc metallopeptidase [Allosalinactinospora lopnorensis]